MSPISLPRFSIWWSACEKTGKTKENTNFCAAKWSWEKKEEEEEESEKRISVNKFSNKLQALYTKAHLFNKIIYAIKRNMVNRETKRHQL